MERIGEARAAALMQQQQRAQALPFAGEPAVKPRAPGLPPTPPPQQQAFGQRGASGGDVCMEDSSSAAAGAVGLPPRSAHRRSRSDLPFGYFPPAGMGGGGHQLPQPKSEGGWGGGGDDLFNVYMNLEGLDNGSSPDDRHDDGDSRGSSVKAESSENDSEECAAAADNNGTRGMWAADHRREGLKRSAAGEPPAGAPLGRHVRSLSMDSLMGKLNFSAGASVAANGAGGMFSLEFGSGEFTPVEMKKIMADDKLAEMALADPKRVKRVLANRQSAARSKERKMRYIVELEQKVQILQTEATTLSAQLTLLQRDSAGMATQNNELRFRLQSMEQQAQLRDALNDALTAEVQRLKIATAELGDSCSSNTLAQQMQLDAHNQMFQMQQQATQIPFYQLQQNGAANNHDAKE